MSEYLPQKNAKQEIEKTKNTITYLPAVDIYEKDRTLEMYIDMPGVDDKSVDINFEKGILTIKGEVEKREYKDHNLIYQEYKTGNFERSFTVSEKIDSEKIEANIKNGLLKLTLPFMEEPEPKKIQVKVG